MRSDEHNDGHADELHGDDKGKAAPNASDRRRKLITFHRPSPKHTMLPKGIVVPLMTMPTLVTSQELPFMRSSSLRKRVMLSGREGLSGKNTKTGFAKCTAKGLAGASSTAVEREETRGVLM